MAQYMVDAEFSDRLRRIVSKVVEATDAVDALDWVTPGSWNEGDFDYCEIKITRIDQHGDAATAIGNRRA